MGNFPMPSFDSSVLMEIPSPPSLPPAQTLPPYNHNFYLPTPSIPTPSELPPPPPVNLNAIASLPPVTDFSTPKIETTIDITADPKQEGEISQQEAEIRQKIFANSAVEVTGENPRDIINGRIVVTNTQRIRGENDPPLVFQTNSSISARLEKQTANTSDEDARRNYIAWAKEVQNINPQQLTLNGIYPKDACVGKLEGTTTYGVTVNEAGSIVSTQLIKSSGYPLFNDLALRQIRNYNFSNDTGTNQPYHVYVKYNYNPDICPSLSISNLGETTPISPSNSNSIEPKTPNNITPPSNNNFTNIVNPPSNNNTSTPPIPPQVAPPKTEVKKDPPVTPPSVSEASPAPTPTETTITPPVKNEDTPKVLEIETSPPPSPSPENSTQPDSSELQ